MPPVELTGWAKVDADRPETLQFSAEQRCGAWIDLPLGLLGAVEYIGTATCEEHHHPIVRISLLPPQAPDASALFLLLAAVATKPRSQAVPMLKTGPRGAARFGPGCHSCMDHCMASAQTYEDLVNCSHECMWTAC